MCLANCGPLTPEDYFKPGPNYCSRHPTFDKGARGLGPLGFYTFQRHCDPCIVDTIKAINDGNHRYNYCIDFDPDPKTVQLVLDILDQKLGIS